MLIRCERCSTVYELDETVLAPEGAPVQCTKCENVFVAYPPRAAGRTLVGLPALQGSPPGPAPAEPAPEPPPRPTPGLRAPASDRTRSASPQVYRPTPGPSQAPVRAPVLRKDQVGAFESRLKWTARWKWLAPAIVAGVLALGGGAWWFLANRTDPDAERARGEGLALLALDDAQSLDAAIAKLDDAARREPGRAVNVASAALARVVRAELWREDATDDAAAGEGEDPRLGKAAALLASARAALAALPPGDSEVPAVVRAQALGAASARERPRVAALASAARARGEPDPWIDLAEASLDLDGAADARDRAVVRLAGLAAAHPELLRARWLLARGQASLGRTTEALAAAEAVLSANARHEGARRLRQRLTAPPPPPAPAVNPVAQDGNAPAQEPPPRRRARVEAIPAAVPELTTSPSSDVRPILEENRPPAVPSPVPAPSPVPKPSPAGQAPASEPAPQP
ncbi:MAG: zinc-ribbon domain-containing protein [Anaeromyxobacteraceae bacterium]